MDYRTRLFVTTIVFLFTSLGHLTGYAETTAETYIASALLGKFDTVAYMTTDILSSSSNSLTIHVDSEDYLRVPFLEFIDGLNAIGPTKTDEFKKGYSAIIVGAKTSFRQMGLAQSVLTNVTLVFHPVARSPIWKHLLARLRIRA